MNSVISRIFVSLWFFITIPVISGVTPGGDSSPSQNSLAISRSIDTIKADLERKSSKSIIFLGNDGVGKSTLASLTIQEQLVAEKIKETGQVVIVSKAAPSLFSIKSQELYDDDAEIILPVRAETDEGTAIWDFPGFSDQEQQKTFILYCLKRIMANSEEVKIVVVTSEASLQGRGSLFFEMINQLTKIINPDSLTEDGKGLLLVLTHFSEDRSVDNVRAQLNSLKSLPNPVAQKIFTLLKNNVSVFLRAKYVEKNDDESEEEHQDNNIISDEIRNSILEGSLLTNAGLLQTNIPPQAKEVCGEICVQSTNKLTDMLNVLIQALKNPWLSEQKGKDPLSMSAYATLPLDFQPAEKKYHEKQEDFAHIQQIRKLLKLVASAGKEGTTITNAITLMQKILHNLETYTIIDGVICSPEMAQGIRHKLQQINREASQQMIYAQSFAEFSGNYDVLNRLAQTIITSLQQTQKSLQEILFTHINMLTPNLEKRDKDYFEKALTLLKEAQSSASISERQAQCYEKIGTICCSDKKYKEASLAYCHALSLHPENYTCHQYLGDVLQSLGRHDLALIVYQAILDTIALKECGKALIEFSGGEYYVDRQALGDAWFKAGNFDKAIQNYQAAASLMEPEQKRAYLSTISRLLNSGRQEMAAHYEQKIQSPLVLSKEDLAWIEKEINPIK